MRGRHPFEKLFVSALKQSTPLDNQLTAAALELREKGYPLGEITDSLRKFARSLIADEDVLIANEALAEMESWSD